MSSVGELDALGLARFVIICLADAASRVGVEQSGAVPLVAAGSAFGADTATSSMPSH